MTTDGISKSFSPAGVETQAAPAETCDLSPRMGSILRQSAVLFMGNVLLLLGGYGFKIFLARRIGAEGLGIFALGECLVSFALLLVVWEMQQAFFRFIPEFMSRGEFERIRRLIWSSVFQVLFLSLAAAGVLYGTREFWGENVFQAGGLAGALAVFAFMLPPRALEVAARQLARSYKEVRRVVIIQTFVAFPVKVSVSMMLIGVGWGLSGWLWGEAVAYLVSAAGLGWLAFKLTPHFREFLGYHSQILDAFRAQDGQAAENAMRQHNRRMIDLIKTTPWEVEV